MAMKKKIGSKKPVISKKKVALAKMMGTKI